MIARTARDGAAHCNNQSKMHVAAVLAVVFFDHATALIDPRHDIDAPLVHDEGVVSLPIALEPSALVLFDFGHAANVRRHEIWNVRGIGRARRTAAAVVLPRSTAYVVGLPDVCPRKIAHRDEQINVPRRIVWEGDVVRYEGERISILHDVASGSGSSSERAHRDFLQQLFDVRRPLIADSDDIPKPLDGRFLLADNSGVDTDASTTEHGDDLRFVPRAAFCRQFDGTTAQRVTGLLVYRAAANVD